MADLPVSGRLKQVLLRLGAACLGEIDGFTIDNMLLAWNCGPGTILELAAFIKRTSVSENAEPRATNHLAALIQNIDTLIDGLPGRYKEVLLLRFRARGEAWQTLEEIGTKFQLTRERVRQLIERSLEQIRRGGGEGLRRGLVYVEKVCRQKVCPLTPALLKKWIKPLPTTNQFGFAFYVALLEQLEPAIPAWPGTRKLSRRRIGSSDRLESALETVLREKLQRMLISKALTKVQKQSGYENIDAIDFLATIHYSRRFKVEFQEPDNPVVGLARLTSIDIASTILKKSDKILTVEQIIKRAGAMLGAEAPEMHPAGMKYLLSEDKGFYLLGPCSYGLRRHFSIREELWEQLQKDFRSLLKRENRPMLISEALNSGQLKWAARPNTHELACILRRDSGLVDLGRFLFALPEWRFKKRESVFELITRVLEKARRPLTSSQILRRLQKFRSISSGTVRGGLRRHPEIQDSGSGRLGLKSWGKPGT